MQGDVGTINAVTNWAYDVTKITISYFFILGTGYFDAGEATNIEERSGQGIVLYMQ